LNYDVNCMCEKIVCVFYVWETGNASMEQEEEEDNKEGICCHIWNLECVHDA